MTVTTITGTINSGVTLGSGSYSSPLTISSSGSIGSTDDAVYRFPVVYVPANLENIKIINFGKIETTNYLSVGVDFAGTGSLTNIGTITGGGNTAGVILSSGAHLTNFGNINGGYTTFTIGGTGVIAATPIVNYGIISGGFGKYNGSGGTGVQTTNGLNNYGVILGGNSNRDGAGGAGAVGSGTFINEGQISGGTGGAGAYGVELQGQANLLNQGLINGSNAVSPFDGQYLPAGNGLSISLRDSVTNAGTILAGSGSSAGGIGVKVQGGTLTNSGTIVGGYVGPHRPRFGGPVPLNRGMGVLLNGGTLFNSGTISGGDSYLGPAPGAAVQFGSLAGTLVVQPGAVFLGRVVANAAVDDVVAVSGSTTTPLSGIGSEFINFSTIEIDKNAAGTIEGDIAGLANGQIIAGFHQHDTIVLNGFDATSGSYVSGTGLELTNGKTTVTLGITGAFHTRDFSGSSSSLGTTIALADTAQITMGVDRASLTFVTAPPTDGYLSLISQWLPALPLISGPTLASFEFAQNSGHFASWHSGISANQNPTMTDLTGTTSLLDQSKPKAAIFHAWIHNG